MRREHVTERVWEHAPSPFFFPPQGIRITTGRKRQVGLSHAWKDPFPSLQITWDWMKDHSRSCGFHLKIPSEANFFVSVSSLSSIFHLFSSWASSYYRWGPVVPRFRPTSGPTATTPLLYLAKLYLQDRAQDRRAKKMEQEEILRKVGVGASITMESRGLVHVPFPIPALSAPFLGTSLAFWSI